MSTSSAPPAPVEQPPTAAPPPVAQIDITERPARTGNGFLGVLAVLVLLALLSLGVKGIRLGPTLPGFLSPNVAKALIEKFNLKAITTPEEDVAAMMAGH